MQKSTLGTTPWRTQGGCVVDARTCGVRLVGIIILSRGRSTERSGGGHGHVAARRSQVRPTLVVCAGARVATLDPTDVLFGRCARSLPGLLHPRLAKLRLGQGAHLWFSSLCDARAWLLRRVQVCARAFSEAAASKRAPRDPGGALFAKSLFHPHFEEGARRGGLGPQTIYGCTASQMIKSRT